MLYDFAGKGVGEETVLININELINIMKGAGIVQWERNMY